MREREKERGGRERATERDWWRGRERERVKKGSERREGKGLVEEKRERKRERR